LAAARYDESHRAKKMAAHDRDGEFTLKRTGINLFIDAMALFLSGQEEKRGRVPRNRQAHLNH